MKSLKSGKNAGCAVYYYQVGFQCNGYFNTVIETANENSVDGFMTEVKKAYGETPQVRKIRTNNKRVVWVK